jgi:hypothetical protein
MCGAAALAFLDAELAPHRPRMSRAFARSQVADLEEDPR